MNERVSDSRSKLIHSCRQSSRVTTEKADPRSPTSRRIVRNGSYFRSSDGKRVSRFLCRSCGKGFSCATASPCFRQKKRKLNEPIRKLLVSGVSQRRIARLLRVNRKTVVRKFIFLAEQAKIAHCNFLQTIKDSGLLVTKLQFDEMESFEKSKCIPLSIPLMIEVKTRKILGLRVCSIPAKGPLAAFSRKKYGRRPDHRKRAALSLFSELRPIVAPKAVLTSDQNTNYPNWIKSGLNDLTHETVKGARGSIGGQGELKKIEFDPLFDLNHSAAMFRANVNRLFRRTWCTTKRIERLEAHMILYAEYHNRVLTQPRELTLKPHRSVQPPLGTNPN